MVRPMRIVVPLLFVVACGRPLAAQVVDGKLVEEAGRAPVARALVSLVDSAGRAVARSQTRADGGFRLTAPRPGTYRVRAERVGRAATESEPLALGAGELRPLQLEARGEAVMLEGIVAAAGERGCSVRPDRDTRVATVWEEARKALAGAEWTRVNEPSHFSVRQYTRDMDAATLTVRKEEAEVHRARHVTPFRALPVEQLAERGYVQREGRERVYYAPDAEVLLSEAFLDTHCFSLARDEKKPGMVGLAFQPARGRRLPDVSGTFWLDEATAELRELDYEYTGVDVVERAMDHRGRPVPMRPHEWGGRLEFDRNAEGAWFVRRWRIRMPVTGTLVPEGGRLGAQAQVGLVGVRETGAEVVGLRSAAGQVVIADRPAGGAAVRGVVHDSTRARPLAGATVFLVGTEHVTETDSAGAFVLAGVPDGRYSVAFSHPRADSLVYVPDPVEVELAAGREDSVRLSLGRPRRLAAASAGSDSAIALAPLAVMAEATQRRLTRYGFYDRQRVGSGVFMTTEDFVKRRGARLMDRIQGLRGTYLRPMTLTQRQAAASGNSTTNWVFVQYKNGTHCPVPIWINGEQSTVRQLERIPPEDVEAIEVYSGDEVPLRFAQVSRLGVRPPCGAVIVWLRTQI